MKNKLAILSVVLGVFQGVSAMAMYSCVSPVCDNGKSCHASGSTYASCSCSALPPTKPICQSGIIIGRDGIPPTNPNPQEFTVTLDPTAKVYNLSTGNQPAN